MIRSARTIAPLLRALLITSATSAALSAVAVGTIGCQDENAPETWVKKLNDPIQRPAAIKRLMQFFEDSHLELYNLHDDIGERNNLATKMPEKAKELHEKMLAWRAQMKAPMPTPNKPVAPAPGKRNPRPEDE